MLKASGHPEGCDPHLLQRHGLPARGSRRASTTALLYHAGPGPALASASSIDLILDDAGGAPPGTVVARDLLAHPVGPGHDASRRAACPGPTPPAAPYGTALFAHNGASPNGDWKLYVQDDFLGDSAPWPRAGSSTLTTAVPRQRLHRRRRRWGGRRRRVHRDPFEPACLPGRRRLPDRLGYRDQRRRLHVDLGHLDLRSPSRPRRPSPCPPCSTARARSTRPSSSTSEPRRHDHRRRPGRGHHHRCRSPRHHSRRPEARGQRGPTTFLFTVSLSTAPTAPVSVRYATDSLDATPGRDYTSVSGTLTFAASGLAKTISVPVVGDRVEEHDEFFKLVLRYPIGRPLPGPRGGAWARS